MAENEQAPQQVEPHPRTPATMALCVAWVLVFLAMAWQQGSLHARGQNVISGGIGTTITDRFGSVTAAELQAGQDWRALTATFLHLSLFHLGFNLLMLFQLGRLVEPWYGSGLFLAVYVVIGWAGNMIAAFSKAAYFHYFPRTDGQPWDVPSAGGSGVLCGLVALVAVVGWRSRTRFGDYIRAQMVGMLAFIGALGLMIPKVDNFSHASGALVGVAVGFAHRRLIRLANTVGSRILGVLALAAILLCAAAQANLDRTRETLGGLQRSIAQRQQAQRELALVGTLYRRLALWDERRLPYPTKAQVQVRALLAGTLERLDALETDLDEGDSGSSYRRYVALAREATHRRPSPGEIHLFLEDEAHLGDRIRRDETRDAQKLLALAREFGAVKTVRRPPASAPKPVANEREPSRGRTPRPRPVPDRAEPIPAPGR
jgi:rhomboid protease GluP